MSEEIKPEHKGLLEKIRALYRESGGEPGYGPEEWGIDKYHKSKTGIEIDFDYGVPYTMSTPEGSYQIIGSGLVGDTNKFLELFNQAFDVEILSQKRNDDEVMARSGLDSKSEYQTTPSGPYVRITEKAA